MSVLQFLQSESFGHVFFFFSSRRRHTRFDCDWSSDVCSSDLLARPKVRDSEQGPTPAAPPRSEAVVSPAKREGEGAKRLRGIFISSAKAVGDGVAPILAEAAARQSRPHEIGRAHV